MAKSPERIKAEKYILSFIDKFIPGSPNKKIYEESVFPAMNDNQFVQFMKDLSTGEKILALIDPNLDDNGGLSVERNFQIADELGHNFHQKLVFGPSGGKPGYTAPIPVLVAKLPMRRQAQHYIKKISVAEDNNSVDDFTGQPSGKSRASRISYPELQVLAALGLDNTITELMKYRGGDTGGFNAMNDQINKTGAVRLEAIADKATGVESTKTLKVMLTSMHFEVEGLVKG
jgi:hypothetical protein